jgi:hypothetical protein
MLGGPRCGPLLADLAPGGVEAHECSDRSIEDEGRSEFGLLLTGIALEWAQGILRGIRVVHRQKAAAARGSRVLSGPFN